MPVIGYCRNLHVNLCPCFVCSKKFSLDNGVEDLLTHICFTHRIIVENLDRIADFKSYMEYYAKRYEEAPIESFAKQFVIEVTGGDREPREQKYYLLGEFSPEDEKLRKTLHARRLIAAQQQQKIDLSSRYFERHCFFCHRTLEATNTQFVHHLRSHGFLLGHPEKLVYIDKFIEAIEDTFRNFRCLYCEMEFESCRTLVHHMEKKGHLKIHPNNSFYDQFYMINYVEFGKTWLDFAKVKNQACPEETVETSDNDDIDWSSWGTEPENIMCLFCKHVCRSWDGTLLHMQVSHNFDFKSRISRFDFYRQVKVVNYVRKRILNNRCINCDFQSENQNDVTTHMETTNHLDFPDDCSWDREEFFFCALENDMFLYHLEDNSGDENDNNGELIGNSAVLVDPPACLNTAHTKSENSGGLSEHMDVMSPEDEFEEGDSSEAIAEDSKNLISGNGIIPTTLRTAAHIGAGDSVGHIDIIIEKPQAALLNRNKLNEFGDA